MDDKILRFSSPGIDCYADGTVVADGECYALVWSPAGKAFSGFNADGTALSADDRVVMAAPLAKDGRCRDTIFQVEGAAYNALKNGNWSVCLVDTRNAAGIPTGIDENGDLVRVNRWGLVCDDVQLESSSMVTMGTGRSSLNSLSASSAYGARTTSVSSVPDSLRPPRITALEIGDHTVALSVEGTVPYLTYEIESGDSPSDLYEGWSVDPVDGNGDGEIVLRAWKAGKSQFFRVKRAEPR